MGGVRGQATSQGLGTGTSPCCTWTPSTGDLPQPGSLPVPTELAVTHSCKVLPIYLLHLGGLQDEVVFLFL